jgi:hypothetical protein
MQVALYASGTLCKWHSMQVAFYASGILCKWHSYKKQYFPKVELVFQLSKNKTNEHG